MLKAALGHVKSLFEQKLISSGQHAILHLGAERSSGSCVKWKTSRQESGNKEVILGGKAG